MKKALIIASMAVLALVSCEKKEFAGTEKMQELSIIPMAGDATATRGYTPGSIFNYAPASDPTNPEGYRTMQISAYLYPQDGEQGNYFVNKTYAIDFADELWHATPEPIYWPVGGTMDFLAFSLSEEKNVNVVWNEENAASQVVLSVPGENTQNDILFASAAGVKSNVTGGTASTKGTVNMVFNHAQAWLQFNLTSTEPTGDVVKFKRIVLEDVYNAGELAINNNGGAATATWDFSGAAKQDIAVDDIQGAAGYLSSTAKQLNMLIPQQKKTAFVIYYTLGTDTQELSYRFDTDLKTWLMGEKYIYNICLNTSEVTVSPKVTNWTDGDVSDIPTSVE